AGHMKFLILFCSATLAVATDGTQSENPPAAVPTPAPGNPEAELVSPGVQATVPTTKEERNKAVALRVFEEIFNQGKFSVADEIYAPDFKNHGLDLDGHDRFADLRTDQNAVHDEKKAFPDLKMTVNKMVAEGDLVAVHWTFRGTHTHGGYAGLAVTVTRCLMPGNFLSLDVTAVTSHRYAAATFPPISPNPPMPITPTRSVGLAYMASGVEIV